MESLNAVSSLAALAHESRLAIYRLLVEAGPGGVAAGAIGARLKVPPPTLSFHLAHLAKAGLVQSRQEGRFVFYSADFKTMNSLVSYLTEKCCKGTCDSQQDPHRASPTATLIN